MGKELAEKSPAEEAQEMGITLQDIKREEIASDVIAMVVQNGATLGEALEEKGITYTTWYRWLNEGKVTHLLINARDQVREGLRLRLFSRADKMIERIMDIGLGELENANAATQLRALTTMLIDMMGMENPQEGQAHGLSAEEYLEMANFEPTTVIVQNIGTQVVGAGQEEDEGSKHNRSIEDALDGEYEVLGDGG